MSNYLPRNNNNSRPAAAAAAAAVSRQPADNSQPSHGRLRHGDRPERLRQEAVEMEQQRQEALEAARRRRIGYWPSEPTLTTPEMVFAQMSQDEFDRDEDLKLEAAVIAQRGVNLQEVLHEQTLRHEQELDWQNWEERPDHAGDPESSPLPTPTPTPPPTPPPPTAARCDEDDYDSSVWDAIFTPP